MFILSALQLLNEKECVDECDDSETAPIRRHRASTDGQIPSRMEHVRDSFRHAYTETDSCFLHYSMAVRPVLIILLLSAVVDLLHQYLPLYVTTGVQAPL